MPIFDFLRRPSHRRDASEAQSCPGQVAPVRQVNACVDSISSKELALKVATVYRCVDILSKSVAMMPMRINRNMGGWYAEDKDDIFSLHYLLRWQANERLSAFEMRRQIMVQLCLEGNAYVFPEMWGIGTEGYHRMVLAAPHTCSYIPITNEYIVNDTVNGIFGTYPARKVIHIKNLGTDGGFRGISTLQYASKVMAVSYNADVENAETFKNGGLLRGFVSGKGGQAVGFGAIQDKQLQTVADDIEKQINSGKNIFNLPGEMSFSQISLSPKDIELLATKQFNVFDICRFFGVHPDKVFAQQTSNYKASEMSQVSFLTDTLLPYLTQIQNEFQIKLIPRSLIEDYLIDFDTEPLMQTDLQTQAEWMKETIANGARTPNEWRRKLGHAPMPGGDEMLVSANLIPLNSAKMRGEEGHPNGA